jgi:hypothetical protein
MSWVELWDRVSRCQKCKTKQGNVADAFSAFNLSRHPQLSTSSFRLLWPRLSGSKQRLAELRTKLEKFQEKVKENLQKYLDASREEVAKYYSPRVIERPPDAFSGQLLTDKPTENDARKWLSLQLDRVFPKAEDLIKKMELVQTYKDVTFETLNRKDFLPLIQEAFPTVNWEKAYKEFRAAGEKTK